MTTKRVPFARLDWDDIRLFLHVYRTGSFSMAAKQLQIDQSTVSRRLSHLELSVGRPLFERHPTGLRATDPSHVLAVHAETMASAMLNLREQLTGNDMLLSGSVRIAMMEEIGVAFVARHLQGLRRKYPSLRVEQVTTPSLVSVGRKEADVFVSLFKPIDNRLACENVGTVALYLYASKDYLDVHGCPASLSDLPIHSFIGYLDDFLQVDAVQCLSEVIKSPNMSFQSNSILAQVAAAASGLGLALLPKFAVVKEDALVPVLDLVKVIRPVWLSSHRDLQYSRRIKAVMEYLRTLFEVHQNWLTGPPDR